MLYLICITVSSVDLAHYRVSRAKDWASVGCGTRQLKKTDGFGLSNAVYKTQSVYSH